MWDDWEDRILYISPSNSGNFCRFRLGSSTQNISIPTNGGGVTLPPGVGARPFESRGADSMQSARKGSSRVFFSKWKPREGGMLRSQDVREFFLPLPHIIMEVENGSLRYELGWFSTSMIMGERVDFEIEWWVRAFQELTFFLESDVGVGKTLGRMMQGAPKSFLKNGSWFIWAMILNYKVWVFSFAKFCKKSTHRVTQWYFWILFINHHIHYDSSKIRCNWWRFVTTPCTTRLQIVWISTQLPSQQVQHHSHECGAWVPWGFDVGAGGGGLEFWGRQCPGDHELYSFW